MLHQNDNTTPMSAAEYDENINRTIPYYNEFYVQTFDVVTQCGYSQLDWLDLGCGTGLLSLLLLQRQPDLFVTGVEIQEAAAALARKASTENNLEDRLSVCCADLRQIRSHFPTGSFDLCISNPPYYAPGRGKVSAALGSARSELTCTLEDVCAAAAWLLRWGGNFCLVHKPERLSDVLCAMREHKIEPKQLRFVCKNAAAAPSLFLCEGRRGGNSGLAVLPPLLLDTPEGQRELNTIYFRKEESAP